MGIVPKKDENLKKETIEESVIVEETPVSVEDTEDVEDVLKTSKTAESLSFEDLKQNLFIAIGNCDLLEKKIEVVSREKSIAAYLPSNTEAEKKIKKELLSSLEEKISSLREIRRDIINDTDLAI